MMISASREERRLVSVALCEFEAKHIAVKRQCSIKIRYFQVNVADPHL